MTVSQQLAQAITTEEFLAKVLPHSGIYMLFLTKEKKNFHMSYTSIDTMASAVEWFDNSGYSVYHACGSFQSEKSRKAENTAHFRSFFLDLDCGFKKANESKGFIDKAAACNALKDFCKKLGLPKPTIINSGGGFHVYWTLQDDIEADEWLSVATKLKQLTRFHKFSADDARTADRASLLRPVKATNHKYSPTRQVKALHVADDVNFTDFKAKIEAAESSSVSFGATSKIPAAKQVDQNLLGIAPEHETAKNIQRVYDALSYVPADCNYEVWRDCIWALLSTGWNCATKLAMDWSSQSAQHWKHGDGEKALQNLLTGFDPEKTVTLGTLFHHAFENGYTKEPDDQVDMSPVFYNKELEEVKMSVKDLLNDTKRIIRNSKNAIANHSNAMTIIRYTDEWDGVLAYDELSESLVLLKPIPGTRTPKSSFKARSVRDEDFIHSVSWFNRNGFPNIGKDKVIDAVETVAKETVISPVRHYLEGLKDRIDWNPSTHRAKLPRLFQDYFGTIEDADLPGADPMYLAAVGQKFMISAVARALSPGCKVDTMLVLEGGQGAGKSSAARILAGVEYFSDNLPPMGTKDASDHVRGKWIIEVGELSAMQKSEIEITKAFISRQEEKFRPAYNRKEITYKRRCVFIGTTNQDSYLRDETGNRRFWPVRVGKIDLAALKRDRDLLWAEALYHYNKGKKWYLTEDEGKLAATVQQDRVSEDIWQAILQKEFEDKTEVAIAEAAAAIGLFVEKQNRAEQNRIVSILKALGFNREGRFTSGKYRNAQRYTRSLD